MTKERTTTLPIEQLLPPPFPPLDLFKPDKSVLARLRSSPDKRPGKVASDLFPKPFALKRLYRRFFIKHDLTQGREWSRKELDEACKRGAFPCRPSDLFLNIFADILTCLTREPLAGSVSPSLIGTSGTIPLSIVSTIPDIMRHYYDVIVLAQKEVFLVTNYWQPSDSVNTVAKALRDLDKRIAARKGPKVVVKIMWDRGAFEQLVNNHARVGPSTYTKLGVPAPAEVPNLSIEVINFHKPLLGTFHQKSLVVDRRVALLNSNNIQDRPNLEMMVHLEGPVVDSMYDVLLMAWNEPFRVALPCLCEEPYYSSGPSKEADSLYTFADENQYLKGIDITKAAKAARLLLEMQRQEDEAYRHDTSEPPSPSWWKGQRLSMDRNRAHTSPTSAEAAAGPSTSGTGADGVEPVEKTGGVLANVVWQMIEKMREEKRTSLPRRKSTHSVRSSRLTEKTKVDEPSTSAAPPVKKNLSIDTGATKARDDTHASGTETPPRADVARASDALKPLDQLANRGRGHSASSASHRLNALAEALNAGARNPADAAITDDSLIDDFKPHVLHRKHAPFPIALSNRRPHGMPGHQDVRVPQGAAWLAALRYAQKEVFIQTPTLNAKPIVRAILEACTKGGPNKSGISVVLWLDLGFNDQGESVPFQGGTNEEVVVRLYTELRKRKKQQNLQVYWYTGKDQIRPLNAVHKTRNCHIKFMAVDGQVGIMGNGNQDTQSWFHSGEQNITIDSPQIVSDWMEQLRSNQSTGIYGRVDDDGIYRDPDTKEPLQPPKRISCFTAIWSMI